MVVIDERARERALALDVPLFSHSDRIFVVILYRNVYKIVLDAHLTVAHFL